MIGSARAIADFIRNNDDIAVITHIRPDGDAYGSALCMLEAIRALGKRAFPACSDPVEEKYTFLPDSGDFANALNLPFQPKAVLTVDVSDVKRKGDFENVFFACENRACLDHHATNPGFCDVSYIDGKAAAAGEMVIEVIRELGLSITADMAVNAYTAISTDTGNFSYNSNRPQIYPMIATLIEAGVDKDAIYNAVFNQYSVDRMKLVGYCLYQKMRVFPEHHAALIYLNRKELYRFNFQKGDAEGIVNMPLQSKDIHYSIFMREDKATPDEMEKNGGIKTKIKLSFRSQGDRPVNVFASEVFNGGGHANAAGGEYYGTLAEAVQLFLDNYAKYFKA